MSSRRPDDRANRALDEVLEAEAQTRAPDRLLENVFARTTATRQARRRPWDGYRRSIAGPVGPLLVAGVVLIVGASVIVGAGGLRQTGQPPFGSAVPGSPTLIGVSVADVCANGRGLTGSDNGILWAGCPTGIRRLDVAADPPVVEP